MPMMFYSAIFGLCFFIIPLWAYRKGLKDGLNVTQGRAIEPIKTPLKLIEQHKEAKVTKAENDRIAQGLANLFAYDGTPQKGSEEQ